jgi:sulfofructose kinase
LYFNVRSADILVGILRPRSQWPKADKNVGAPKFCEFMKCDILGLGGVAVDDLIYVEHYPPPDAKVRVLRRERQCGGLTATALVAAARLGARCAYAGVLGKDDLSRFTLDSLRRERIDVSHVRQTSAARPIHSTIVVDQNRGTRNIFFDIDQVVGAGQGPSTTLVTSCRVLFVDNLGVSGMVKAARLARRKGVPVVGDFENDQHPQFPELLSLTNHLIVSREFAARLTGLQSPKEAVSRLAGPDREVAVVTDGDQGCWYWAREWTVPRHQPAFEVKVVDTTGCGDVFHGAYAFGLARDMNLEDRIRLASAAAALKVTKPGGQSGIPSLSKVKAFLKNQAECA